MRLFDFSRYLPYLNFMWNLGHKQIFSDSRQMLSISQWRRHAIFLAGGLLIGIICVGFAYCADAINTHFLKFAHHYLWATLLVTPIGFALTVSILNWQFKGSEGSGIPQVIAALRLHSPKRRRHLASLRIAIGKFLLTMLAFASGASIGREGPTIQLAASIMDQLSRFGKFHKHDMQRGLLLAGGAAGIAAAFNAPLAGIVFAIEELSGSFEKGVSGTIIATVVLSGIVSEAILGNYLYFGISKAVFHYVFLSFIPIVIVAIIGGLLGGLFSRLLLEISEWLNLYQRKHFWLIAAAFGLGVALLGIISGGETFGSGYQAAKGLIADHATHVSFMYGFEKMLATLLSYLSGIPGGIFAPSLSAGAGLGQALSHLFPSHDYNIIIIIATVAYFSGVVQSPITCFIIVMEMTDSTNSTMVLPIMVTSLIATGASKLICREAVYQVMARKWVGNTAQINADTPN